MTDKSRTERRLIASIRHAKIGDEAAETTAVHPALVAADTSGSHPDAKQRKPQAGQDQASKPARLHRTGRIRGYQSPGRVWPD